MSLIWFLQMIVRVTAYILWDFNPKQYKFKYQPYREHDEYPVKSWFVDDYDRTYFTTYFHYIWNIKPRNYEN